MSITRNCLFLLLCLLVVLTPFSSAEESMGEPKKVKQLEKEIEEMKEVIEEQGRQIRRLEPPEPVNIQVPPRGELAFPSKILPISEVIQKGTKIPFEVIVDKHEYRRPAY